MMELVFRIPKTLCGGKLGKEMEKETCGIHMK